jgi:hypothetical protein
MNNAHKSDPPISSGEMPAAVGGSRLLLDANVWALLARSGEAATFDSWRRWNGYDVVVPLALCSRCFVRQSGTLGCDKSG